MHVGSAQHGARSFPPLAGANHDAGHSGTIVRAIAARIRVAGRRVSREFDRAGILQSASSDGAGNFQKTIFLARGKRSASAARHRREAGAFEEPEYPQNLLQIYDPPVMLYVRGDATILNSPALSIVGTRRPTVYGMQMAERMGRDLAARGLTIVGGLARGIDAIAHGGATAVGGRAIGVLGTGIDICYPKENKKLYEKVLERGPILSDFRPSRIQRRRIFRCGTGLSPGCRWAR
jgi:predicted Rossmann fold nucleotide-binding protein DprA/Smf involved in DNA uptake